MILNELTEKQKQILTYMILNMKTVFPSYRDIGKKFNMTAKGAYDHVKAIERKGYINKKDGNIIKIP